MNYNYIVIIIAFLAAAVPLIKDTDDFFKSYKLAKTPETQKKYKKKIIFNVLIFLVAIGALCFSLKKQIGDDDIKKQSQIDHNKELNSIMTNFKSLITKSKSILGKQDDASTKIGEQLKTSKNILENTDSNLVKAATIIKQTFRVNNPIKNSRILFNVKYNLSDTAKPNNIAAINLKAINNLVNEKYQKKEIYITGTIGRTYFGHPLKPSDVALMDKNSDAIIYATNENNRLQVFTIEFYRVGIYDLQQQNLGDFEKFVPGPLSPTISITNKLPTKFPGYYYDIMNVSDLLLDPERVGDKEELKLLRMEVNFRLGIVQQTVSVNLHREYNRTNIQSILDFSETYLTFYASNIVTKKPIVSFFKFECGDDFAFKMDMDQCYKKTVLTTYNYPALIYKFTNFYPNETPTKHHK